MNYSALFDKLYEHKVRYVICGGLAVNLHGVPRMTADVDIILDYEKENLENFQKSANELHYQLSVPVQITQLADDNFRQELMSKKNLLALSYFNFDNNYLNLDVVLNSPISFEMLWNNRVSKKNNGSEYYIVSVDDLITLKQLANRVQDIQDIHFLSQLKHGRQG
jgi:hypothetical protein